MRKDRDTIVAEGLAAKRDSETSIYQKGPWIYKFKFKCGRRATQNVEMELCNIPHLYAVAIQDHARENEVFHIHGIQRIMKSNLRSRSEDI